MRASDPSPARAVAATLAPLAATAVGVFAGGGYSRPERLWFTAGAVVALGVTLWAAGPLRVPRALAGVLLALAGFAALSTLWTIGLRSEALVWAATAAGYAAVLIAAATAAALPGGVVRLAAGCAVIVTIASVLGLVSAALGEPDFANRVAGAWRPAGPFEYPPALALAQTAALPALLAALTSGRRWLMGLGAAGLGVAAAVLVLAESRLGLALGIGTAGAWLLAARAGTVARARSRLVPVTALAVVAAGIGAVAFGSSAGRGAGPATDVLHGRGHLWGAALDTFADRPLHGAGAGAFLTASARHQDGQTIAFAHDLPLELAAELGVLGVIGALALYAASLQAFLNAHGRSSRRWLGAAGIGFLAGNLVDWPWHLAGAGALWAVAMGALAGEPFAAPTSKGLG